MKQDREHRHDHHSPAEPRQRAEHPRRKRPDPDEASEEKQRHGAEYYGFAPRSSVPGIRSEAMAPDTTDAALKPLTCSVCSEPSSHQYDLLLRMPREASGAWRRRC